MRPATEYLSRPFRGSYVLSIRRLCGCKLLFRRSTLRLRVRLLRPRPISDQTVERACPLRSAWAVSVQPRCGNCLLICCRASTLDFSNDSEGYRRICSLQLLPQGSISGSKRALLVFRREGQCFHPSLCLLRGGPTHESLRWGRDPIPIPLSVRYLSAGSSRGRARSSCSVTWAAPSAPSACEFLYRSLPASARNSLICFRICALSRF